jgi:hypothetical protein
MSSNRQREVAPEALVLHQIHEQQHNEVPTMKVARNGKDEK